ncbi:transcriptional repressor, partial [Mesorhizobium sp. M7A.F.Ca.US.001.01.1.1]
MGLDEKMDLDGRKENVAVDKRVREAGLRPTRQ